jgi:putative two-component system response regulator
MEVSMGYQIYEYLIYFLYFLMIFEQVAITIGKKKRSVYHMLLCTLCIITVGGYLVMMNASTAELALEANKVTYLGGCLLPIVVLKIGADMCNINMKMWVYGMLAIVAIVVLGLAWSSGYVDQYYTSYYIEKVNGMTVLHKEYGPWHNVFYFYLLLYFIVAAIVIVHGVRNYRNYSNKVVILYTVIWGGLYFTYFGERFLHLNIKLMPIMLAIGMTCFVVFFRRANLLSMNTNFINIEERVKVNGYIVFNLNERLMSLNEKMMEFFPELKDIEIDSEISELRGKPFYEQVFLPMITKELTVLDGVEANGRYLRAYLRRINAAGQFGDRGWVIGVVDVSEEVKYKEMLKNYQERLEAEVLEKTKDIDSIRQTIVMGMASMIESRDFSTGGHIRRTSDVVNIFAKELLASGYPLSKKFLRMVVIAAPMHDLGKIGVDDAVLKKKGKYTPEEYEEMKKHAANGAVIVRRVFSGMSDEELVNVVANVANYHHEKWNGQGYPLGLKGEEIPVEARIMALADVFDALVSKRYYKEAYSYDDAFKIIEESIGSHFDPELGKIFLKTRPKLEEMYDRYARDNAEELRREAGE